MRLRQSGFLIERKPKENNGSRCFAKEVLMAVRWRYAKRMDRVKPSIIREFARLTEKPEIISFAGGAPAAELFPIEELKGIALEVLEKHGRTALQYSDTAGNVSLRKKIASRMGALGVKTTVDNIHILSGSQQGVDYAAKIFLDPGDVVVCECPTYLGAINAFRSYQGEFAEVSMDDSGMILEDLERILETHLQCKLIYVIPDFQNPTGKTWSARRRREFMDLVNRYNMPVVEDHPYGALRFEGEHVPPIKAFDTEGRVMFLGTFSKTFCPGFRVGWICAGEDLLSKFYMIKGSADLQTNSMAQAELNEYLERYDLDERIRMIANVYRRRRDTMLKIMDEEFPPQVTYNRPAGGLFIWVELPEGINAEDLMYKALEKKVAFVPGAPFYANGGHENTVRLNFSNMSEERIVEGMKIMAQLLREALG
jgi:2-aminoadipate transaminase